MRQKNQTRRAPLEWVDEDGDRMSLRCGRAEWNECAAPAAAQDVASALLANPEVRMAALEQMPEWRYLRKGCSEIAKAWRELSCQYEKMASPSAQHAAAYDARHSVYGTNAAVLEDLLRNACSAPTAESCAGCGGTLPSVVDRYELFLPHANGLRFCRKDCARVWVDRNPSPAPTAESGKDSLEEQQEKAAAISPPRASPVDGVVPSRGDSGRLSAEDTARELLSSFVAERKEQLSRTYDSPLTQEANGYSEAEPAPVVEAPVAQSPLGDGWRYDGNGEPAAGAPERVTHAQVRDHINGWVGSSEVRSSLHAYIDKQEQSEREVAELRKMLAESEQAIDSYRDQRDRFSAAAAELRAENAELRESDIDSCNKIVRLQEQLSEADRKLAAAERELWSIRVLDAEGRQRKGAPWSPYPVCHQYLLVGARCRYCGFTDANPAPPRPGRDRPVMMSELIRALRLPGAHGPAEYALSRVATELEGTDE